MKKWEMPVVEEISLSMTENGGVVEQGIDDKWFDAKGALTVSFGSQSK